MPQSCVMEVRVSKTLPTKQKTRPVKGRGQIRVTTHYVIRLLHCTFPHMHKTGSRCLLPVERLPFLFISWIYAYGLKAKQMICFPLTEECRRHLLFFFPGKYKWKRLIKRLPSSLYGRNCSARNSEVIFSIPYSRRSSTLPGSLWISKNAYCLRHCLFLSRYADIIMPFSSVCQDTYCCFHSSMIQQCFFFIHTSGNSFPIAIPCGLKQRIILLSHIPCHNTPQAYRPP